jgi:uncharacterized protein (DUF2141 family)
MNITLRNLTIAAASSAVIMLFSQCCTCGDQMAPVPAETNVEDEMGSEDALTDSAAAETTTDPDPKEMAAEKTPVAAAARRKPLSITITDLKSATAPVIFSVYDDPKTYLDPKAQLKTYRFVPKGNTLKIKLTDLPFGTYAIAFYQDMNDSGAIDKNGLGIPKEPYAFSNDIRPKLSAPSFEDCKFIYSKTAFAINVKMGK